MFLTWYNKNHLTSEEGQNGESIARKSKRNERFKVGGIKIGHSFLQTMPTQATHLQTGLPVGKRVDETPYYGIKK